MKRLRRWIRGSDEESNRPARIAERRSNSVDVNLKVPALEKLLDIVASGIGSVAGPMQMGPMQMIEVAEPHIVPSSSM